MAVLQQSLFNVELRYNVENGRVSHEVDWSVI
jgi:hypothetical protein